jgi:transcriptional regulator with XRE-family HTH domain
MSDVDKFLRDERARDPEFKKVWDDPEEREATSLGMSLCLARELRGLTVKQLARKVKGTPEQILDMELDVRSVPREMLVKVLNLVLNKAVLPQVKENNVTLARRVAPDLSDRLRGAKTPTEQSKERAGH